MKKQKNYIGIEYSRTFAMNINEICAAFPFPKVLVQQWRKQWLSYPVTEEQFFALKVIATFIWGREPLIRRQLSKMSHVQRMNFVAVADAPKPIRVARLYLLRRKLEYRHCYVRYGEIYDYVKCFCPNGCVSFTRSKCAKVRKWVENKLRTMKPHELHDLAYGTSCRIKTDREDRDENS